MGFLAQVPFGFNVMMSTIRFVISLTIILMALWVPSIGVMAYSGSQPASLNAGEMGTFFDGLMSAHWHDRFHDIGLDAALVELSWARALHPGHVIGNGFRLVVGLLEAVDRLPPISK